MEISVTVASTIAQVQTWYKTDKPERLKNQEKTFNLEKILLIILLNNNTDRRIILIVMVIHSRLNILQVRLNKLGDERWKGLFIN